MDSYAPKKWIYAGVDSENWFVFLLFYLLLNKFICSHLSCNLISMFLKLKTDFESDSGIYWLKKQRKTFFSTRTSWYHFVSCYPFERKFFLEWSQVWCFETWVLITEIFIRHSFIFRFFDFHICLNFRIWKWKMSLFR